MSVEGLAIKQITIKESRVNKLLGRVEYVLEVEYEGGHPSRGELREALTNYLKVPDERIVIVRASSSFGRSVTNVNARLYDSKELLMSIEPKHILIKNGFIKGGD